MEVKEETASLVGRDKEMRELFDILNSVKEGDGNTVFISGEPGVGKTKLVEELVHEVHEDDFLVIKGTCRYDNPTPYKPIEEAFIDSGKESLGCLLSVKKDENIESKEMRDAYRNVAFYDTAQHVKKISYKVPVIFFLDDMHWADQGTLNLFHYLSDRLQNHPVLFIGTYCPGDALSDTAFMVIKRHMSRKKLFLEMELSPLDKGGTGRMIKMLTDLDHISEEFVNEVHEITEGKPLFIKEGILNMMDENTFREDERNVSKDFKLPFLMEDVINRRIYRLGYEARELLQFGAVFGKKVPYDLLKNISELGEFEILDAVDEMIENRLWCEDDKSDVFYFSHNIVRNIVYEGIGRWVERKRLHQKTAETLDKLYKGDQKYNVLAYHLCEAENYSAAVKNYIKAGKKAEEVYSHEDAVEMYQKALSIFEKCSDFEFEKIKILERMADGYNLMGMYGESRKQLYKALEEVCEKEEERRIYRKIANSLSEQGEYEEGLELLNERPYLIKKDTLETSRLLGVRAWCLLFTGRYEEAMECFEQGKSIAEEIGDDKEIAQAFHNLGSMYLSLGDYDKAFNNFDKALDIWRKIEDNKGFSDSLNNLAGLNSFIGNLNKALEQYYECLNLYKEMGHMPNESMVLNNIGVILHKKGALKKAVESLQEALKLSKKISRRSTICNTLISLGHVYKDMDERVMAESYLEKGMKESDKMEYMTGKLLSRVILAQLKLEIDELDKARDYIESVNKLSSDIGVKREEAISTYLEGSLLREEEQWREAEDKYQKALEEFDDIGEQYYVGKTLYDYGLMCQRKGDNEKASKLVQESLKLVERRGMKMWAKKCRNKLAEL